MKRYLFFTLFILGFMSGIVAQDIIILKTGDEIQSRVLEIGEKEVKYKKFKNPDGPLYALRTAEIFMIKYENGTRDVFGLDSDESAEPVLEEDVTGDYAILNIYRPKGFVGSFIDYDLRLSDEWVLCTVKNNSWASIQVSQTGWQRVWAKTEASSEAFINIEPGNVYYIRCGVKMGLIVGRPSIEVVPNEVGEAEFEAVQLSSVPNK
ncbi:MAG: hypothetical protein LBG15_11580 [Dysgonamonadaceae bacterium]|jgi:hypothetical protein|nr:hypothetical protein [Dysgonamonadaceae bacterium]